MTLKFIRFLALGLTVLAAAPLAAQTAAPPVQSQPQQPGTRAIVPAPAPMAPAPVTARSVAADLESFGQELTSIETQSQRPNQSDGELQRLRGRLDPVLDGVREIIAREMPRLDEINARLEKIGAKPADGAATESPEVARNREEQERLKKEVDNIIRVARLVQVRAEQATTTLSDLRRDLFKRAILERSDSIASPWLWQDVVKAIPQAAEEFSAFLRFRLRHGVKSFEPTQIAAAIALILATLIGYMPARRLLLKFLTRKAGQDDSSLPSRGYKAIAAVIDIVVLTLLPFAVSLVLIAAVGILGFGNDRLGELLKALILILPLITFAQGLLTRIVAADKPLWRIAPFSNETATFLQKGVWLIILVVVSGKVFEAINQTISAALPFTVAAKGVTSLLCGLTILYTMRRIKLEQDVREEALDDFGPAVGAIGPSGVFARLLVSLAGLVATLAPLVGYVVLGSFVIDLMLWIIAVGCVLWLLVIIVDEYISKGLGEETEASSRIRAMTGLAPAAIKQIGILISGIVRLALFSLAALLTLAPLGLDPSDIFGSMKSAFFGFHIGGVSISPSAIIMSVVVFLVTFFAFRAIRRWVEDTYLPHTSLDVGLRNSISTVIGYSGFLLAAVLSLSYIGLSFDKLAIVAGALSLGIGIGLQSIVGNFVSGLILLWERPIRVGDLIVVGTEQGRVRRINVRATEIETFDKSSLIVPNSEFISGRVQNKTHSDRVGRIIIPVGVAYDSDPEVVRQTLLDVALHHQEVCSEPRPSVLFKTFAESSLDFDLVAFADVESVGAVRSDLMFAIHKAFREKGIEFPFPHRTLEISGVHKLSRAIADHMQDDREPARP